MATMSFFALGLANVIPFIGTEFFPATDEGQFRVFVRLPVASAVEKTQAVVSQVENIIFEEVPEIKTLSTRAGSGGGMGGGRFSGPHVGNVQAMLVDQSERNRSSETIARTLRISLAYPDLHLLHGRSCFRVMLWSMTRSMWAPGLTLLQEPFCKKVEQIQVEFKGDGYSVGRRSPSGVQVGSPDRPLPWADDLSGGGRC
jgi:hypothetical protein